MSIQEIQRNKVDGWWNHNILYLLNVKGYLWNGNRLISPPKKYYNQIAFLMQFNKCQLD